MSHYAKMDAGRLSELGQYEFTHESLGEPMTGKLFLGERIDLTSMEVSLNKDAPNTGTGIFHSHINNEEVYIFLSGQGEMVIDEERIAVQEGSVVRISPQAKRAWWNTGDDDLYYIVVQAHNNSLKTATLADANILQDEVPWRKG